MTTDPILEELHRHREDMLRECNNDPEEFFRRLLEHQRQNPQPARPAPPPPNPSLQRTAIAPRFARGSGSR